MVVTVSDTIALDSPPNRPAQKRQNIEDGVVPTANDLRRRHVVDPLRPLSKKKLGTVPRRVRVGAVTWKAPGLPVARLLLLPVPDIPAAAWSDPCRIGRTILYRRKWEITPKNNRCETISAVVATRPTPAMQMSFERFDLQCVP